MLPPVRCSVSAGTVRVGDALVALDREGKKTEEGKVTRLFARRGMSAVPMESATAGDIVEVAGFSTPVPTSTLAAPGTVRPLWAEPLDPPTLSMCFGGACGGARGMRVRGSCTHCECSAHLPTTPQYSTFNIPRPPPQ